MAKDKTEEMLRAHVAFELARFEDDTIGDSLEEELGALYDWLREVPLNELIPRRGTLELIRSRLLDAEATDGGREFLRLFLRKTRVQLSSSHMSLAELLPPELNQRVAEDLASADQLRLELIRELVHSRIFTRIISEILFEGIKSFALENNLTKNLPGASALLSLGQNLVSGMAPGLEGKFESNIKDFIATHSGEILKNSEDILVRSMRPELLREGGESAWKNWSGRSLADVVELLPRNEEHLPELFEKIWGRIRRPLLENLTTLWLDLFLNQYGYKPAGFLLDEAGIDRATFLHEGDLALGPALRRAREDGYLEARIRARLGAFYQSDAARKFL